MLNEVSFSRRSDALANHARIIASAQEMFAAHGLDVEVGEIAARAGVGVGTLYRHFANRDDLLRAAVDQTVEDVFARLGAAAATEDPAAAVRAMLHASAEMHKQHSSMFAAMHDPRLAKLFMEQRRQREESFARIVDLFTGCIRRGIEANIFRPDLDPSILGPALMGAMGFVFKVHEANRPLDNLADTLADFYLAALSVR